MCVSKGKRLPKAWARDSARAVSPARANARAASLRPSYWWEQAAKPRPLIAGLPRDFRTPLPAAPKSPGTSLHFLCWPFAGQIHRPPGQIARLVKMTGIGLSGSGKSQSIICISHVGRKPSLLIGHRCRVSPQKRQSIESFVKSGAFQLFRLRFLNDPAGLIEALESQGIASKALIPGDPARHNLHRLTRKLDGLFVLSLLGVDDGQAYVADDLPGIALYLLLKCLGSFIQLSGYMPVVGGCDLQPFPLARVLTQLECLGEVLSGALIFAKAGVVQSQRPVSHGKVRIELMAC